jgi:hypothetical protein
MLKSDPEFLENQTSENRDVIFIINPHTLSDLCEITYDCAIKHS